MSTRYIDFGSKAKLKGSFSQAVVLTHEFTDGSAVPRQQVWRPHCKSALCNYRSYKQPF